MTYNEPRLSALVELMFPSDEASEAVFRNPLPREGSATLPQRAQDSPMELQIEYEMAAPADAVWQVAGEGFADLSWSSDVTHSELDGDLKVGAVRTCHFPPNIFSRSGQVKETLSSFDRSQRQLAYQAELGGFIRRATNRWSIEAVDAARCRLRMHATIELRGLAKLFGPLLRPMLARMGRQTMRELETKVVGDISTAALAGAPEPVSIGKP